MLLWEIRVTSLISDAGELSSCYSAGSVVGIYTTCVLLAALAFYLGRLHNKADLGQVVFLCVCFSVISVFTSTYA